MNIKKAKRSAAGVRYLLPASTKASAFPLLLHSMPDFHLPYSLSNLIYIRVHLCLRTTMADRTSTVPSEHAALVQGLTTVYKTLIAMDYLNDRDVHFPQEADRSSRAATEKLRSAGVGKDAIILIQQLPCLSEEMTEECSFSESGVLLAPGSQAITYTADNIPDAQDIRFVHNGAAEIGQNDIKISRCGPICGADKVYNFAESRNAVSKYSPTPELIVARTHADCASRGQFR